MNQEKKTEKSSLQLNLKLNCSPIYSIAVRVDFEIIYMQYKGSFSILLEKYLSKLTYLYSSKLETEILI